MRMCGEWRWSMRTKRIRAAMTKGKHDHGGMSSRLRLDRPQLRVEQSGARVPDEPVRWTVDDRLERTVMPTMARGQLQAQ